jgi:hypothetical protein
MTLTMGGYDAIASSEAIKRLETKLEIEVGAVSKLSATVTRNVPAFQRFMAESTTDGTVLFLHAFCLNTH